MQGSCLNRNFSKDIFFDLHVHGNMGIIKETERLGFTGIGITRYFEDYNSKFLMEFQDLTLNSNIILKKAVEIYCKNPQDLKKKVKKSRKKSDILIVKGGDLKINRAACEDKQVDILSQPYRSRRDMGINHVLARKAAENSVAIEINIKTLLKTSLRYRYRVISQFRHIIDLQRKFQFPLIITSGANTKYDLKTPLDILSLAKCFGMTFEECFKAISITPQNIIEKNNIRDKFIVEGVRTLE